MTWSRRLSVGGRRFVGEPFLCKCEPTIFVRICEQNPSFAEGTKDARLCISLAPAFAFRILASGPTEAFLPRHRKKRRRSGRPPTRHTPTCSRSKNFRGSAVMLKGGGT